MSFVLVVCLLPRALLQDLKETSRLKSDFIHVTKGGWEQVPILQDKLLELQEKLLKALKELTAAEEEKQKKEAALTEARKTLSSMNGKVYQAEEDACVAKEAVGKAQVCTLFRELAEFL